MMYNDNVFISFEIKNKQQITSQDMQKFISDSQSLNDRFKQPMKIFMFYSYHTKIPSKENFTLEIKGNDIYTYCYGESLI